MLAPLDNETIFKKAFTNKTVFEKFVKDLFDVDVSVDKIETEKSFHPVEGNIDFKLDIYAETIDKRFIIEIQRIDYDYNFDRFLHYFLSVITEQQRSAAKYRMEQQVLAVVILTRPYIIDQITGEPISDNVMTLDFDLENLNGEKIKIWEHNIVFLNPHPKYEKEDTPAKYKDWLDLFQNSINENVSFSLNIRNAGIAKVVELIDYERISPQELEEAKIAASKKAMLKLIEEKGIKEGKQEAEKIIQEKTQQLEEKDQQLEENKKELEQNKKVVLELAKLLKENGVPIIRIQEKTNLSKEEIERL